MENHHDYRREHLIPSVWIYHNLDVPQLLLFVLITVNGEGYIEKETERGFFFIIHVSLPEAIVVVFDHRAIVNERDLRTVQEPIAFALWKVRVDPPDVYENRASTDFGIRVAIGNGCDEEHMPSVTAVDVDEKEVAYVDLLLQGLACHCRHIARFVDWVSPLWCHGHDEIR